jgi:hypothetical protein
MSGSVRARRAALPLAARQRTPINARVTHPVLALQRMVGNRATAQVVQRQLRENSEDLEKGMPRAEVKSAFGKVASVAYKEILRALNRYHGTLKAAERLEAVTKLEGYTKALLTENAERPTRKKVQVTGAGIFYVKRFEALHTAAAKEKRELEYQVNYMRRLSDRVGGDRFIWQSSSMEKFAATPVSSLAEGGLGALPGSDFEGMKVMHDVRLTDAELLALRIYSLDSFWFSNAALRGETHSDVKKFGPTTSLRDYMHSHQQIPTERKDFEEKGWTRYMRSLTPQASERLRTENIEHAKMAWAALRKLPPGGGSNNKVHRGEHLTPDQAAARFAPGKTYTTENFYSTSKDHRVAHHFAHDTDDPTRQKILLEITHKTGRDIQALSAAPAPSIKYQGQSIHSEAEVLILPGTTLTTRSVDKSRSDGVWVVRMEETASPNTSADMPVADVRVRQAPDRARYAPLRAEPPLPLELPSSVAEPLPSPATSPTQPPSGAAPRGTRPRKIVSPSAEDVTATLEEGLTPEEAEKLRRIFG